MHNKKLQLETVVANDDFERLSKVQEHDNIIWDAVNRTERAGTKIINSKDSNNSQPLPLEKYYYYMTDIESYNKLVDIVRNELGADSKFDSLIGLEQEEAVADIMGDIIADPKKYRRVFAQDVTFGQRVLDYINGLIERFKASTANENGYVSEYTRKLLTARNQLTKIMADSVVNMQSKADVEHSGNTAYSVMRDSKGNTYWNIDPEKDIFKGLKTKDEYVDAAYNYLLKNRDNKVTVKDNNGKEITFIRLSAEEFTNSKESQELYNNSPDLLTKKMRMIPSLQDILLHSSVEWHSKDHKDHKLFKEKGFDNYRGKVRVGSVIFNTVVRVGNAKFGNVFYDINLEVDTILPHTKRASEIKNVSTSNDNISQNEPTVNTQYMQNGENNAKNSTMRGRGAVHGGEREGNFAEKFTRGVNNGNVDGLGLNRVDVNIQDGFISVEPQDKGIFYSRSTDDGKLELYPEKRISDRAWSARYGKWFDIEYNGGSTVRVVEPAVIFENKASGRTELISKGKVIVSDEVIGAEDDRTDSGVRPSLGNTNIGSDPLESGTKQAENITSGQPLHRKRSHSRNSPVCSADSPLLP